ncbi:hypothetical protein [Longitalea arenae]|nr:hypothetical protein [Longitalea arenae]
MTYCIGQLDIQWLVNQRPETWYHATLQPETCNLKPVTWNLH